MISEGVCGLKCNLLGEKDGLYMLVLLASPRWLWCTGEYLLVSYRMIFCMEQEYIHQDISATWEKLIKPTYRAHLFHHVSCTLTHGMRIEQVSHGGHIGFQSATKMNRFV